MRLALPTNIITTPTNSCRIRYRGELFPIHIRCWLSWQKFISFFGGSLDPDTLLLFWARHGSQRDWDDWNNQLFALGFDW